MTDELDAAARLVERMLSDPALRGRFRSDPVGVAREEGLDDVADTLAAHPDGGIELLEVRESRSNLAGALMAAALEGVDLSGHGGGLHGGGSGAAHAARLAASAAEARNHARAPIDPDQFGQSGSGGPPTPEDQALLHNRNVVLDANGIADVRSDRLDPRVIAVMTKLSQDHKLVISSTSSDHPRLTTGGSVSNHTVGRAFDIASIDGESVGPGSAVARRVALALSSLPESIRPSEIGSPWALPGAAYFTDAEHQNHLHVGFDDPVSPSWTPPADLASDGGNGGAAAPVAAAGSSSFAPTDEPEVDDADDDESDDEDDDALAADGESDDGDSTDFDDGADEDDGEGDDEGDDEDTEDLDEDGEDSPDDDDGEDDADGDDEEDDDDDEGEDDEDDGGDSGDDEGDSGDSGDDEGDSGDAAAVGLDGGGGAGAADFASGTSGAYPGDDVAPERVAAWMAAQAQKRGLPAELPLMASLVESGMKNLSGGDADSVGFFQMRVGIWNNGAYAGYPQHPDLQLRWFLDNAAAVKRQRLAAGEPLDPQHYGDWIADVERPAAEYRGRYQLRLGDARSLLFRARDLLEQPAGPGAVEVSSGTGAGTGAGRRAVAALAWARGELGVHYAYGGESPKGFDCSGLMQWAYAKVGISLPRTSEEQILASNGTPVGRHDLLPGDLVFFRDSSGDVHHVGMSLGGDKFIEAPHTGADVRISSLNDSYYAQQFTGGRRFDHGAAAPHAERLYLRAIDPSRRRPA